MKENGYIAVDVELTSLLAVAEFRGIDFAEFLIADDNIDGKCTDKNERDPAKLFQMALEIVTAL